MLQKKNYITPTTRFATMVTIIDYDRLARNKRFRLKKNMILTKKRFSKTLNFAPTQSFRLNLASVVFSFTYNKTPYQLILNSRSIYNNYLLTPGIEGVLPGKKIFDFTKNCMFSKPSYTGSQIFLVDIPYHIFVSNISNNLNNKWTFVKASGTFGIKLKAKKTVKLVLVKLPSSLTYFFLKGVRCFIGKNTNFFNNKFIEGKWGNSLSRTKQLAVRGVAMNPVDHPNGGRTKAKQPEKSPWGWIAKCKK